MLKRELFPVSTGNVINILHVVLTECHLALFFPNVRTKKNTFGILRDISTLSILVHVFTTFNKISAILLECSGSELVN